MHRICSNVAPVLTLKLDCKHISVFWSYNVAVDVFFLGVMDAKCSLSMVPGSSAETVMTLTSVKIALKLANTAPDIRLAE